MLLRIELHMIPPTATAQEKGFNTKTKRVYTKAPAREARAKLRAHLAKYAPDEPMTGPLELHAIWRFPVTGKHHSGEAKITKPDTDNLQKMLKDVMTDLGFWKDDAQIYYETVTKMYSSDPGIFIITGLPEDDE